MFFKYSLITVVVAVVLTVYLYDYNSTTYKYLKLKSTLLKESVVHTLMNLGVLKSWKKETRPVSGSFQRERLFTVDELSKYTGGEEKEKLYLAILGKVYDVGSGRKHYGPAGGYHFFTGRDATRAFVTGDFTDSGLTDDVKGLTPKELKSLLQWDEFYRKEYKYKGKLIGRYYDADGKTTRYSVWFERMVKKGKYQEKIETKNKVLFPPCNVEWTKESGSRFWCSNMSGGIERDWVGVPRRLYVPGSKSYRCSCINMEEFDNGSINEAQLQEYPNCDPKSTSCNVVDI